MSEDYSVPALEAFGNDPSVWSELNLRDVQTDATISPPIEALIERNVKIIEGHILAVEKWRKVVINQHLQRFGKPPNPGHRHNMSHAERSDAKESTCNRFVNSTPRQNQKNLTEPISDTKKHPNANTPTDIDDNNLNNVNLSNINKNTDNIINAHNHIHYHNNADATTNRTTNTLSTAPVPVPTPCSCAHGESECDPPPGKTTTDSQCTSSQSGSASGSASESSYISIEGDSVNSLPQNVKSELVLFVRTIAFRYNNVLYHNFEHASHVTASVNQLVTMLRDSSNRSMSRRSSEVTTSSSISASSSMTQNEVLCNRLPITHDSFILNPMVHLALIITALTHDVEHQGVGNKQLVEEGGPLAVKYKGNSVAENNSFDVWNEVLCKKQFDNLRQYVFGITDKNQASSWKDAVDNVVAVSTIRKEMDSFKALFHQLSHDVIMATDISCPRRLKEGKEKWIQTFEHEQMERDTLSCASVHRCIRLESPDDERERRRANRRSSFPPVLSKMSMPRRRHPRRSSAPHKYTSPTEFIADPFPDQTKLPQLERNFNSSMTLSKKRVNRVTCPLCHTCNMGDGGSSFNCHSYKRISAILEQMIQAADVAHTMQSWPVFIKWNEKLYYELWVAKVHQRGPDCLDKWFDGQISFFDKYIFPLADRLKQCDVFGEVGSIFYENANLNRERWILEGQDLCRRMHEKASKLFGTVQSISSD